MGGGSTVYSFRPIKGDRPADPSGLSRAPGARKRTVPPRPVPFYMGPCAN